MTQILQITQDLPKETLQFEAAHGVAGDGSISYGSPVDFEANVVPYDVASQQGDALFVIGRDGNQYITPLTLYVQGDEPNIPSEEDRITWKSTQRFIVRAKKVVSGLFYTSDEPDHIRLRCSREGA